LKIFAFTLFVRLILSLRVKWLMIRIIFLTLLDKLIILLAYWFLFTTDFFDRFLYFISLSLNNLFVCLTLTYLRIWFRHLTDLFINRWLHDHTIFNWLLIWYRQGLSYMFRWLCVLINNWLQIKGLFLVLTTWLLRCTLIKILI
jgi:hypothetical protein